MTDSVLSLGDIHLDVPTLTVDLSDYAPIFTVTSPLALSDANVISVNLSTYQKKLDVFTPLRLEDDILSLDLDRFQMKFPIAVPDPGQAQLWDYTTGAFRALAAAGGITLTTSADGRYVTIGINGANFSAY